MARQVLSLMSEMEQELNQKMAADFSLGKFASVLLDELANTEGDAGDSNSIRQVKSPDSAQRKQGMLHTCLRLIPRI